MTQLQQGAQVFDYRYDPSDYRIGINAGIATRDFYLEGEHLEAVYGPGGLLTDKYLRGVVIDEVINGYHYDWPNKEKNLTFHHDHLNSVTAVTGHDGTTVETASYGPFGAMTSETGPALSGGEVANKLRYTGREFDRETGLYYYRARYYDPEIGRFYTEDPLRFRAGINFYAYVNNNPLNANDPSGLDAYYVSRPLDLDPRNKISHNFFVYNAKFLGDPEATVISFGRMDNGNLGRVTKSTDNLFSGSTYQSDKNFWNSHHVREGNASLVTTSDSIAARVVETIQINLEYGYWNDNSNSAAHAVAERAYHDSGFYGPVAPPNMERESPGINDYGKIQFGPSSENLTEEGGGGFFWDFDFSFSFGNSQISPSQELKILENIMDNFVPDISF